jgi:hypothetical protein
MLAKLEHALELARRGFYIFPCNPNSKTPAVAWTYVSTRNEGRIRNWWTGRDGDWPQDFNIAIDCGKSNLFVLDVDTKKGRRGLASFRELDMQYGITDTFMVRTPSKGFHLYYRGGKYRNSAGKLGEGLDTRSAGGYVMAPGSTIEVGDYPGEYTIEKDVTIEPIDGWLDELLKPRPGELTADKGKVFSEDHPDDIDRASEFASNYEPAIEGSGGDHHTFVFFCRLKEIGVSKEKALELADLYWNLRCSPPWEHEDLAAKCNSAWKSAQNATGSLSAHAEFDIPVDKTPPEPDLLTPLRQIDIRDIPPRQWVYGSLAMRGIVSVIVASAGAGKSTLAIAIGVSKATDKPVLGMETHGRGRVAVYNNEDDLDELERRTHAALQFYKIPLPEVLAPDADEAGKPWLYLNSGVENPLRIAKRSDKTNLIRPDMMQELIDNLIFHGIDMLIVDPFITTHDANENDNGEIDKVARMWAYVAKAANCAVVLVHHTRKLSGASTDGHSGNLDSMRGASALGGVARIVVTFDGMSPKHAKKYAVAAEDRWRYLLLEQAKGNFSKPTDNRLWFERHGEIINPTEDNPDGESIGVLRPVNLEKRPDNVLTHNSLSPRERKLLEIIIENARQYEGGGVPEEDSMDEFFSCLEDHAKKKMKYKTKWQAWDRALTKLINIGRISLDPESKHIYIHTHLQIAEDVEDQTISTHPHAPL